MMAKQTDQIDEGLLTERVIFPVSKAMLKEITDFRFEHRIDSKSEALRQLVEEGLASFKRKGKK